MEEAEQMYVRIMQTVLHAAAQTGEVSIVQFTLDHGADTKVADTTGRTALQRRGRGTRIDRQAAVRQRSGHVGDG